MRFWLGNRQGRGAAVPLLLASKQSLTRCGFGLRPDGRVGLDGSFGIAHRRSRALAARCGCVVPNPCPKQCPCAARAANLVASVPSPLVFLIPLSYLLFTELVDVGSAEVMLAASVPDRHGAIVQLLEMATMPDGRPIDITELKYRWGRLRRERGENCFPQTMLPPCPRRPCLRLDLPWAYLTAPPSPLPFRCICPSPLQPRAHPPCPPP